MMRSAWRLLFSAFPAFTAWTGPAESDHAEYRRILAELGLLKQGAP